MLLYLQSLKFACTHQLFRENATVSKTLKLSLNSWVKNPPSDDLNITTAFVLKRKLKYFEKMSLLKACNIYLP